MKKFLEIGKIVSVQGLKGEVRVYPWCNDAAVLLKFKKVYLDEGTKTLDVLSSRVKKNIVIMKFRSVDSIELAKCLLERVIYIDRKDMELEENEYFIQDILGLDVYDKDGEFYGKVTDVLSTRANDVYEVTDSENKKHLIPVVDEVINNVDLEKRIMKINPIKGLFNDEN